MKKPHDPHAKAQAMMEYVLVMCVIVVIVFLSFKNGGGGVLQQTHDKTVEYFDAGSTAVMGGYYDASRNSFVQVEPRAVNGVWCGWTTCINHVQTRECACPRPAFGGSACQGAAAQGC